MSQEPQRFSRTAEKVIADFRGLVDSTPEGMRVRPTLSVKEWVDKLAVKYQIGQEGPETLLRENWSALVGPANAHYSHPVSIDPQGRLLVLVAHAVVRNELFHSRRSILTKIQALPGCGGIRELNLRSG